MCLPTYHRECSVCCAHPQIAFFSPHLQLRERLPGWGNWGRDGLRHLPKPTWLRSERAAFIINVMLPSLRGLWVCPQRNRTKYPMSYPSIHKYTYIHLSQTHMFIIHTYTHISIHHSLSMSMYIHTAIYPFIHGYTNQSDIHLPNHPSLHPFSHCSHCDACLSLTWISKMTQLSRRHSPGVWDEEIVLGSKRPGTQKK